jgi:hypothetical protein
VTADDDEWDEAASYDVSNEVSGDVTGNVVQAGRIDQVVQNIHQYFAAPWTNALETDADNDLVGDDEDEYEPSGGGYAGFDWPYFVLFVGAVLLPGAALFSLGLYIHGLADVSSLSFLKVLALIVLALILAGPPLVVVYFLVTDEEWWNAFVVAAIVIAAVVNGFLLHPLPAIFAGILLWVLLASQRTGFFFFLTMAAVVALGVFARSFFWVTWPQAGNVMGWLFSLQW